MKDRPISLEPMDLQSGENVAESRTRGRTPETGISPNLQPRQRQRTDASEIGTPKVSLESVSLEPVDEKMVNTNAPMYTGQDTPTKEGNTQSGTDVPATILPERDSSEEAATNVPISIDPGTPEVIIGPLEPEPAPPEPVSAEVEMKDTLQGEFLLPLKEKDTWSPNDTKSPKKGGIRWGEVNDNKTFIQYYLHCPYDTKTLGLTGGNYIDKISEKFGLKKFKADIKIDRPDFSQPDKTSKECKNAKMLVDKEELIYEDGHRAKPYRPNGEPTKCYMTGLPINNGAGKPADGYQCEHYLIIGDIGNSLRLALDEYENIFKKMVDKKKFEEFQGLSKELWKEVYKPSQPPSNLLKAQHDFINLNHKDLSVSVNYHNIMRMMTTLVFGYLKNNAHSISFCEKFLDDIMEKWGSEEVYLYKRIKFLFKQAEDFCKLWNSKLDDKMLINSSASVLTTIRYLHMKKIEQLKKISAKKPSSTAMKSITSFLKVKIGENGENFLKKRLAKSLSVFNNFEKAARKIISGSAGPTLPYVGGGDDTLESMKSIFSTPPKGSGKLERRTTETEHIIPVIGKSEDRGILEILSKGEMTDDYDKLSVEVKTLLVNEATEITKLEYKELSIDTDFKFDELLFDISHLIEEGNNPPDRFDGRRTAHKYLLIELYDSNEELLDELKKIELSEKLVEFLKSEEMIEYNELLETARSILLPTELEPEPEMGESETEMGTLEGQKKKTKKKKTRKKRKTKRKPTKKSHRKKKRKTTRKKKKQSDLIDKIIDRLGY